MSTEETSRFVRLRVELVVEIDDRDAVTRAALERIADDPDTPDDERAHAEGAVTEDTAEALAYLVDPFDLVGRTCRGSNWPRPPGAASRSTTTRIRLATGTSTTMMSQEDEEVKKACAATIATAAAVALAAGMTSPASADAQQTASVSRSGKARARRPTTGSP